MEKVSGERYGLQHGSEALFPAKIDHICAVVGLCIPLLLLATRCTSEFHIQLKSPTVHINMWLNIIPWEKAEERQATSSWLQVPHGCTARRRKIPAKHR